MEEEIFKDVMALAPAPVAVVTAYTSAGEQRGLTVSAVCSVSLSPPLVLTCLERGSNTLEAIRQSGSFTVNYLASGESELALRFATKAADKFCGVATSAPAAGLGGPILVGAVGGHVVCRLEQLVQAGDHEVAIGEVLEAQAVRDGLAYGGRQFFSRVSPIDGIAAA